jgi:penicillin G amidase
MLRKLILPLLLLCALLISPLAAGAQSTPVDHTITAQAGQEFAIPGLDGPVTILYDAMHVPHIYATTPHDLLMAQGFVHAADRWWQMEMFRHQGSGRLTEIVGTLMTGTDTYLRTMGLARNAQNDIDNASPEVLAMMEAYSAGVNAWLADKSPDDVALEYTFINQLRTGLGADPITEVEPWTPLNSATWLHVMSMGLSGNMGNELLRARVIADGGDLDLLIPGYDYEHMPLILQPGRTLSAAVALDDQGTAALAAALGLSADQLPLLRDPSLGSNNWVVSGARTESGYPLLANDPHLSIMMPSIWYEIGLHCVEVTPECPYDVSGFSFAGSPFVVIGHTERVAWGVTNVGTDVQDLYTLEINPDNPLQYRFDGEWVDMDVITETLTPWDGEPEEFEVHMTHFGPVVTDVVGAPMPVALRWAAATTNRNVEALMLLNQATNWDEFQHAITYWDLAAQNFVYADVDGNIGYITSGLIPMRAAGQDGSAPVDGTSSAYDWLGYVDPLDNPRLFNPDTNYIVTANNAIVAPDDYPYTITEDWALGQRALRIEQLIQATEQHTPDTFASIQFDNYNWGAASAIPIMAEIDFGSDLINDAVAWLAEWDYQNDADSPQAALFNAFWREFVPLVFDEFPVFWESLNLHRLDMMWDDFEHPIWHNDKYDFDPPGLMGLALARGIEFMETTYGTDWSAWRWGDLHVARFKASPLGQLPTGLDPRLDAMLPMIEGIFNREQGVSGGPAIVNATSWSIGSDNFDVGGLPSMRMILDLSDWDNSRLVHTTGQSGDPMSDHYDDMIPLWATGEHHAHAFSTDAVEAAAVETWTLVPAE